MAVPSNERCTLHRLSAADASEHCAAKRKPRWTDVAAAPPGLCGCRRTFRRRALRDKAIARLRAQAALVDPPASDLQVEAIGLRDVDSGAGLSRSTVPCEAMTRRSIRDPCTLEADMLSPVFSPSLATQLPSPAVEAECSTACDSEGIPIFCYNGCQIGIGQLLEDYGEDSTEIISCFFVTFGCMAPTTKREVVQAVLDFGSDMNCNLETEEVQGIVCELSEDDVIGFSDLYPLLEYVVLLSQAEDAEREAESLHLMQETIS